MYMYPYCSHMDQVGHMYMYTYAYQYLCCCSDVVNIYVYVHTCNCRCVHAPHTTACMYLCTSTTAIERDT